jgi:hypothetical protein
MLAPEQLIHPVNDNPITIRSYTEIEWSRPALLSRAPRPLRQLLTGALAGSIAASRAALISSIRPSLTMHRATATNPSACPAAAA